MSEIHYFPRYLQPEMSDDLLARIRSENLNVYRASVQRLREDLGQESQIAQDYRGRLIYELLQNADDAMSSVASEPANIAFVLDHNDLWVANSGRPLDGADVRGLCGISASSKGQSGNRRASIGHKGMGFKSVLEITDAPEVYSTTISFRFGPADAVRAVKQLIDEGIIDTVTRAPVTRFPWPVNGEPELWRTLRARGMRTAFRFPLLAKMTTEQRDGLAAALRHLPVTSLVFLKHLGRVEVDIQNSALSHKSAWTVTRDRVTDVGTEPAPEFSEQGTYRVVLTPDDGVADTFLLAYKPEIQIENHRGGLGEISWEGVNVTEVSIAARMRDSHPIALDPEWRKLHVFLPTGEACPYDLLISGAFNSNLSRQEIRVESEASNYNRFLLQQVARTLRDTLIPRLRSGGSSDEDLRKIDRQVMNTRGDMLFARALVFFEGETEEQAVPDFAEKYWGKHPNDLGYSLVGVGGKGNYLPFLRMAESFKIPWFIFSDGETDTINAVNAALAAVGQTAIPNNPRVIVLPGGKKFETYIVTEASKNALISTIIKRKAVNAQHLAALQKQWAAKSTPDQLTDLLDELEGNKTQYGSVVGKILPVPAALEELFKMIDIELTAPKSTEKKA